MMMRLAKTIFVLIISLPLISHGQMKDPVDWRFSKKKVDKHTYKLKAVATIDSGWHIYSKQMKGKKGDGGFQVIPLQFNLQKSGGVKKSGAFEEKGPLVSSYDSMLKIQNIWYKDSVVAIQKVQLLQKNPKVSGHVQYQTCNARTCLPPDDAQFTFRLEGQSTSSKGTQQPSSTDDETESPPSKKQDTTKTTQDTSAPTQSTLKTEKGKWPCAKKGEHAKIEKSQQQNRGYWTIFLLGLAGGFIAILTPCVFPMIPLTVSFFTKDSDEENQRSGLKSASIFGVSIIVLYVGLGFLLTFFFGADVMRELASSVWLNFFFFLLFLFFALSFFGAFELRVPSSWTTKSDQLTERGGTIGIFFMAFTLALVSFSCTAPIIGTLLVGTALQGSYLSPILGMAGFSIALALPFTLFAAFPAWLSSLPRSGGWMNTVKVVMGFLELALALKFLSIADLVGQWGILKREVFLSFWIIILALLGLYLLGKLRFPLDSKVEKISVTRLMFAIFSFAFALYLIPGIWGAPVKLISGIAPPSTYKEWKKQDDQADVRGNCPHNIPCFYDFEKGMAHARKVNKPVLLDFTGYSCENCRRMEDNVWAKPEVLNMLKNDYVLISLYVDKQKKLPESEQYISDATGEKVETVGDKWVDLQITCYNKNSQPYYVPIDHSGKRLAPPKGYVNVDVYRKFLEKGLNRFEKQKKPKGLVMNE